MADFKFLVGQKVRVIEDDYDNFEPGNVVTIITAYKNENGHEIYYMCDIGDGNHHKMLESELEAINEEGANMADARKELRNLKLPADDRLLIEEGLLNDCGDLTDEGEHVVIAYALKTHRAEIVKDLKTIIGGRKTKTSKDN